MYGYTLVAPKEHREQVTGDLTLEEYVKLQSVLYRVAEAVRQVVPTERLYLLSLGSQQGNRHVHVPVVDFGKLRSYVGLDQEVPCL